MQKLKVLIIEDEELIAQVFKKQLELLGHFNVQVCLSGKEGLDFLKKDTVDIVLLDLMMMEMDGFEVLESIKNDPRLKDIPVIILTNVTNPDAINKAKELGAVDYIIKTDIKPDDLISKIHSYVER